MRKFLLYGFWIIFLVPGCGLVGGLVPVGYDLVSQYGFTATTVYMTARGGVAKVNVVQPVHGLQNYSHLKIQETESAIGEEISPELLKYLNIQITDAVQKIGFDKSGEKTLLLKGRVIHLSNGIMEKYIVVKFDLLGADTNESLGEAVIEGRSEGIHTIKAAAEGVAVGIANLLAGNRES